MTLSVPYRRFSVLRARAISAAGAGLPSWRALSFVQRRACLVDFAAALLGDRDRIAEARSREQGKPLARALSEIGNAVRSIEDICTINVKPQLLRDTPTEKNELVYRQIGRASCRERVGQYV